MFEPDFSKVVVRQTILDRVDELAVHRLAIFGDRSVRRIERQGR